MDNDKAFAVYVLLMVGGLLSLLTALTLSGSASVPPLPGLLGHFAMGLGIRAAYKWVGGWDWADWSITGDAVAESLEVSLPAHGVMAD